MIIGERKYFNPVFLFGILAFLAVCIGLYSEFLRQNLYEDYVGLRKQYGAVLDSHISCLSSSKENGCVCGESCTMFLTGNASMYVVGVNGVFFPSKNYYCVWTKNREFEAINETDLHEKCHVLVYSSSANESSAATHFCEDYCAISGVVRVARVAG